MLSTAQNRLPTKNFSKIFEKVARLRATFPLFRPYMKGCDAMDQNREEILTILKRAAFSKANDAVELALHPKEAYVRDLDLWGVSEFKVNSAGTVEVKFADRVKALGLLLDCAGGGDDGLAALLEALEGGEK